MQKEEKLYGWLKWLLEHNNDENFQRRNKEKYFEKIKQHEEMTHSWLLSLSKQEQEKYKGIIKNLKTK